MLPAHNLGQVRHLTHHHAALAAQYELSEHYASRPDKSRPHALQLQTKSGETDQGALSGNRPWA